MAETMIYMDLETWDAAQKWATRTELSTPMAQLFGMPVVISKSHNTYGHNDGKDKRKLEIIDEHPNEESAEDIKTPISKISNPTDAKGEAKTYSGQG